MSDSLIQALQQQLREAQADFDKAPVGGADELAGIEDDDYQCRLESFDIFQGKKNPSHFFLKTFFSIQNHSELGGRELTTLHNIVQPDKLGFLKDHLHALGVDVEGFDLSAIYPGSELLEGLVDGWYVVGVYTNAKGYRNVVVRQRLDGVQHVSDLGSAQEQMAGFETRTDAPPIEEQVAEQAKAKPKAKPAKRRTNAQIAADGEANFQPTKQEGCICPDPSAGQFDDKCPIPGHGLGF